MGQGHTPFYLGIVRKIVAGSSPAVAVVDGAETGSTAWKEQYRDPVRPAP